MEDQEWFPKSWRDYGTDYLVGNMIDFNLWLAW
jgi:hypothetical protein